MLKSVIKVYNKHYKHYIYAERSAYIGRQFEAKN